MDEQSTQEHQINIELDEKIAEGIYSNLVIINHSMSDFVVDFVNVMPSVPKAKSRIILTPQHAKRLLRALEENIQNFERHFGKIQDIENMSIPLFGSKGEA